MRRSPHYVAAKKSTAKRTGPPTSTACDTPGGMACASPAPIRRWSGGLVSIERPTDPSSTLSTPQVASGTRCACRRPAGMSSPSNGPAVRVVRNPIGSSARSQSGQSRSAPIRSSRPSGVMTQGCSDWGGRCRMCWRWRQQSSATHSPRSSWRKPVIRRITSRGSVERFREIDRSDIVRHNEQAPIVSSSDGV